MSAMVYQHSHGAINVYDPEVEGLYIFQFTSIQYTLQCAIEGNGDTITEGKLLCDKMYMIPA